MPDLNWLAAATDTIGTRPGVCAVAMVAGALFIFAGLQNIRTKAAKESEKRRLVTQALGKSNMYDGSKAVIGAGSRDKWNRSHHIRYRIFVCRPVSGQLVPYQGVILFRHLQDWN